MPEALRTTSAGIVARLDCGRLPDFVWPSRSTLLSQVFYNFFGGERTQPFLGPPLRALPRMEPLRLASLVGHGCWLRRPSLLFQSVPTVGAFPTHRCRHCVPTSALDLPTRA